jgi:hypothetical protein
VVVSQAVLNSLLEQYICGIDAPKTIYVEII